MFGFFFIRRWNWTGSIGCTTSWPNSAWPRPPTSTPAQCSWESRSRRAATSSSPPPSSLWRWGTTCSEYSQTWTRAAGTAAMEAWCRNQRWGLSDRSVNVHMSYNYRVLGDVDGEIENAAVLWLFRFRRWFMENLQEKQMRMFLGGNGDYKTMFELNLLLAKDFVLPDLEAGLGRTET